MSAHPFTYPKSVPAASLPPLRPFLSSPSSAKQQFCSTVSTQEKHRAPGPIPSAQRATKHKPMCTSSTNRGKVELTNRYRVPKATKSMLRKRCLTKTSLSASNIGCYPVQTDATVLNPGTSPKLRVARFTSNL